MSSERTFLRLLVWAALADWLITRSLARMAIFMPKSPPVLAAYQVIVTAGQYASVLCALLGLIGVGWLAWRARQKSGAAPAVALAVLCILSLASLLASPDGWLVLITQILLLAITGWLGGIISRNVTGAVNKAALLLPVLAIGAGSLYHAYQALFNVMAWPGPSPLAPILFNFGELLAVLSPAGLWWVYGRQSAVTRPWHIYLLALLPAGLFLAARLASPSMAGILAIWSTGLTLYLPSIMYAASLILGTVTLLASHRQGKAAGWALVLLASAGYAPQLSSQMFLALLALSWLAGLWAGEQALPLHAQDGAGAGWIKASLHKIRTRTAL